MYVVTAFIEAIDNIKEESSQLVDAFSPGETSKNDAEQLPKDSIPNNTENVKESSKNNVKFSKEYLEYEVNTDLTDLVEKVKKGEFKQKEKVFFGTVPENIAALIKKETGIDPTGFHMAIEARQIEHILGDHGEHGKTDTSMKNMQDIGRIEYVLLNPDELTAAGRTRAYSYMKNGHNKTAPTVLYEKNIGDRIYYVVQAVPDSAAKTLYIVTAYMQRNKTEAPQLNNAQSPAATSEIDSVVTSDKSIPNNTENVKESSKNNVKFSKEYTVDYNQPIAVSDVEALRSIGRKSINEFTDGDIQKSAKWAHKFYKEMGTKSPFFRAWFGDWRAYDNSRFNVVHQDEQNTFKSGKEVNTDTGKTISWNRATKGETINHAVKDKVSAQALNDMPSIIKNAVLLDSYVSILSSKSKMPNTAFMHSFYTVYKNSNGEYLLKLYVEEAMSNRGDDIFTKAYQLKDIEKVADITNSVLSETGGLTDVKSTTYTNSISDLYKLVKQYDKNFMSKEVNPAMLNDDGTPKEFYHGTKDSFTEFKLQVNPKFGRALGDGFYFTDDYDRAFKYANGFFSKGQDRDGKIMPVYLKMENPYVITDDNYKRPITSDHDGIIDKRDGTYMVYNSNQIKSATDNIGTFNSAENDIRYSKETGTKKESATARMFREMEEIAKTDEERETEVLRRTLKLLFCKRLQRS